MTSLLMACGMFLFHRLDGMGHLRDSSLSGEWQKDGDVLQCEGCGVQFSFFCRRHHCRRCGHIFCDACTLHVLMLFGRNEKVCNKCYCTRCTWYQPCMRPEEDEIDNGNDVNPDEEMDPEKEQFFGDITPPQSVPSSVNRVKPVLSVATRVSPATTQQAANAATFSNAACATVPRKRGRPMQRVCEDTYENQRWSRLQQRWYPTTRGGILSGDPPGWSDLDGRLDRQRASIKLPKAGKWQWILHWEVEVTPLSDNEGWMYASDFGVHGYVAQPTTMTNVRRRRWVRWRLGFAFDRHCANVSGVGRTLHDVAESRERRSGPRCQGYMKLRTDASLLRNSAWADRFFVLNGKGTKVEFYNKDPSALSSVGSLTSLGDIDLRQARVGPNRQSLHLSCAFDQLDAPPRSPIPQPSVCPPESPELPTPPAESFSCTSPNSIPRQRSVSTSPIPISLHRVGRATSTAAAGAANTPPMYCVHDSHLNVPLDVSPVTITMHTPSSLVSQDQDQELVVSKSMPVDTSPLSRPHALTDESFLLSRSRADTMMTGDSMSCRYNQIYLVVVATPQKNWLLTVPTEHEHRKWLKALCAPGTPYSASYSSWEAFKQEFDLNTNEFYFHDAVDLDTLNLKGRVTEDTVSLLTSGSHQKHLRLYCVSGVSPDHRERVWLHCTSGSELLSRDATLWDRHAEIAFGRLPFDVFPRNEHFSCSQEMFEFNNSSGRMAKQNMAKEAEQHSSMVVDCSVLSEWIFDVNQVMFVLGYHHPDLVFVAPLPHILLAARQYLGKEQLYAMASAMVRRSTEGRCLFLSLTPVHFAATLHTFVTLLQMALPNVCNRLSVIGVKLPSLMRVLISKRLFTHLFTPSQLARVLDLYLCEGIYGLIRVVLSVFTRFEDALLGCRLPGEVMALLEAQSSEHGDFEEIMCPSMLASFDSTVRQADDVLQDHLRNATRLSHVPTAPTRVLNWPAIEPGSSNILCVRQLLHMWTWLSPRQQDGGLELAFSGHKHGWSMRTLVTKLKGLRNVFLVLKASDGAVFGAFFGAALQPTTTKQPTLDRTSFVFAFGCEPDDESGAKEEWQKKRAEDPYYCGVYSFPKVRRTVARHWAWINGQPQPEVHLNREEFSLSGAGAYALLIRKELTSGTSSHTGCASFSLRYPLCTVFMDKGKRRKEKKKGKGGVLMGDFAISHMEAWHIKPTVFGEEDLEEEAE